MYSLTLLGSSRMLLATLEDIEQPQPHASLKSLWLTMSIKVLSRPHIDYFIPFKFPFIKPKYFSTTTLSFFGYLIKLQRKSTWWRKKPQNCLKLEWKGKIGQFLVALRQPRTWAEMKPFWDKLSFLPTSLFLGAASMKWKASKLLFIAEQWVFICHGTLVWFVRIYKLITIVGSGWHVFAQAEQQLKGPWRTRTHTLAHLHVRWGRRKLKVTKNAEDTLFASRAVCDATYFSSRWSRNTFTCQAGTWQMTARWKFPCTQRHKDIKTHCPEEEGGGGRRREEGGRGGCGGGGEDLAGHLAFVVIYPSPILFGSHTCCPNAAAGWESCAKC